MFALPLTECVPVNLSLTLVAAYVWFRRTCLRWLPDTFAWLPSFCCVKLRQTLRGVLGIHVDGLEGVYGGCLWGAEDE